MSNDNNQNMDNTTPKQETNTRSAHARPVRPVAFNDELETHRPRHLTQREFQDLLHPKYLNPTEKTLEELLRAQRAAVIQEDPQAADEQIISKRRLHHTDDPVKTTESEFEPETTETENKEDKQIISKREFNSEDDDPVNTIATTQDKTKTENTETENTETTNPEATENDNTETETEKPKKQQNH
jgi:hypothetical protein